ncbi:DNA-binding helix-turn-helix protein [Leptospira inadai serovar Lyme str. 10]|uniref:DNA-binding helix-turn-helix protein n=2 Tax=Leptospira inadai serovar Lyme TaxID=293084 RepID=V6HWB3_9LEPT|nr:helix-turn-helix domain-containing protein [Leptospira inadai]EQA37224.1 DNA-binding helix-turn-helix protein [Leptospira inadai serovar Lyme str. 10]PNV74776.1 AraC family transcriptional regulator [Leptospira inadai serovar Lyme]
MDITFFKPKRELQDSVAKIWVHQNRGKEIVLPSWLIVPDGEIKIIFPFYGNIRCTIAEKGRLHRTSNLIISGMRTEPGYLNFEHGLGTIGIILQPEAAYRFFDLSMFEIANRTLSVSDLFGDKVREWEDTLMDLPSVVQKVEYIQDCLIQRLRRKKNRDSLVEYAVKDLRMNGGRKTVQDLSLELGFSRRHLNRRFMETIGVGPKLLANVFRFQSIYKIVKNRRSSKLQDRIFYDRYYDQAHFIKDFRRFTGSSPGRYVEDATDYGKLFPD